MLATACAELRRWVSVRTNTGIIEAMLEAFAKFDYVIWPGKLVWLCVAWYRTHRVEVRLSELVADSVNECLMHESIIDFASV